MELKGKAAVVTGGGTGVGRATVLDLARRGCNVLVNYSRSRREAEETANDARQLGAQAITCQADVADDDACRHLIDRAVSGFGRLDVLVNSAGTTSFIAQDDLDGVTDDVWDEIFAVNVKGAFHCARAAKGPMLAGGGGEIVNITSVAAFIGKGSCIPYCASKAALENLTVALARTLAPSIRVNAIAPGFIAGRWLEKGLGDRYEEVKAQFEQMMPLKRICRPSDVSAAVLGLVAGSDLITGQSLAVDAGMLIAEIGTTVGPRSENGTSPHK